MRAAKQIGRAAHRARVKPGRLQRHHRLLGRSLISPSADRPVNLIGAHGAPRGDCDNEQSPKGM
jgi:hypothetical protein